MNLVLVDDDINTGLFVSFIYHSQFEKKSEASGIDLNHGATGCFSYPRNYSPQTKFGAR